MKVEHSLVSARTIKEELSTQYNCLERPEVAHMHQGFHDSYLVVDRSTKYVLRLYGHNWKSLGDISGEVNLLTILNNKGMNAHSPISDSEGAFVQSIDCPEGARHYVLFNFAPGEVMDQLDHETARSFGKQLAEIHNTTAHINIDKLSRSYLPSHIIASTRVALLSRFPPTDSTLEKLNHIETSLSEKLTTDTLRKLHLGICHGDPHFENALFHNANQEITLIDFDFCGHGYLLYDLGSFFHYEREQPEIQNSFLEGYQSIRTLSALEISLIPYFQVLMQLFHLGARTTHADGIKSPLWPNDQIIDKLETISRQLKRLKAE